MNYNTSMVAILALTLAFLFAIVLSSKWEAIERKNAAYTKDCNERGGVAKREFDMLQCIGARPKERDHG